MPQQTLANANEEWSINIFGVRFVDGTASDVLTSFIGTSIIIFFYYGVFRLLRMQLGIYPSLGITYILIHILPLIILWITKRAFHIS